MKRKTIIGTAIIAAFLMLSTMVFVNPVPATIPKDNPKGLDPELIELVDTYVNGLSTFTNELQANSQTNTLLNDIENNREVMELVNQIKNTEDPEEKQELMKNLIETLKTNNKVEELAKLTQTDSFVKDTIDIEEYMQNMVNYMQENTETTDSALDPKQLSLAETDTYQIQMNFMVIPTIMMVELGEEPEECTMCSPIGSGASDGYCFLLGLLLYTFSVIFDNDEWLNATWPELIFITPFVISYGLHCSDYDGPYSWPMD